MTDTPITPDRDPSRREELLFMLLHGGARDETIAQRVVDLALAEARAEMKAEVDRLRKTLSDATGQIAELEGQPSVRLVSRPLWELRAPRSAHCLFATKATIGTPRRTITGATSTPRELPSWRPCAATTPPRAGSPTPRTAPARSHRSRRSASSGTARRPEPPTTAPFRWSVASTAATARTRCARTATGARTPASAPRDPAACPGPVAAMGGHSTRSRPP